MHFWKGRLLVVGILVSLGVVAFAPSVFATGNWYVDSTSGNDSNNCTDADTPCLTIAGVKAKITALADPSSSTISLSGTFAEAVSFTSEDVETPDTLDGLRLTSTNTENPATIDAAGQDTAISIEGIHRVTIDHLTVQGAEQIGMSIVGTISTYANRPTIRNVSISDLTAVESIGSQRGIQLFYTKHARIRNTEVRNLSFTQTNISGGNSNLSGVYILNSYDTILRTVTIDGLTHQNTSTVTTSHESTIYGVYSFTANGLALHNSTINNLAVSESSGAASTSPTTFVYGVYAIDTTDVTVQNTTFTTLTATTTLTGTTSTAESTASGITLIRPRHTGKDNSTIMGNTIDGVTATSSAGLDGTATVYGIDIDTGQGITINQNELMNIVAAPSSTSDNGDSTAAVYGLDIDSASVKADVVDNRVSTCQAVISYTGMQGGGNYQIYAINMSGSEFTVKRNRVSDCQLTLNNNDSLRYGDSGTIAGLYATDFHNSIIARNTVQPVTLQYTSAGEDGSVFANNYGVYGNRLEGVTLKRNTVHGGTIEVAINDPTAASGASIFTYGYAISNATTLTLYNNRYQNVEGSVTGIGGNYTQAFWYGLLIGGVVNMQATGSRIRDITATVGSGTIGWNLMYGLLVRDSPGTVLYDNAIARFTGTALGSSSIAQMIGVYVEGSPESTIVSTKMRESQMTGENTVQAYGIHLISDSSGSRLFNNVLLGNSSYTEDGYYGIFMESASNHDILVYHNTMSGWFYPILLNGGSKIKLLNNILSAQGANSYSLGVAYNTVDRDTFLSHNNLFYNSTATEQFIYDTSNEIAVALGDWTNEGGSYGYDADSITADPQLTSNGLLNKGSPAINAGTVTYGVEKKSVEYSWLARDINDTLRLPPKGTVDIGADEYRQQ